MKRVWRIECWSEYHQQWVRILGVPPEFKSRAEAEKRMRFEADKRRCRLLNGAGKVVLHAGVIQSA